MALLPTLAAQIFERMDVEGISKGLQEQSKRVAPILEYVKELDDAEQRELERQENERKEAEVHEREVQDAEKAAEAGHEMPGAELGEDTNDAEDVTPTATKGAADKADEAQLKKVLQEEQEGASEIRAEESGADAGDTTLRAASAAPGAPAQGAEKRVFEDVPAPISSGARLPPAVAEQPTTEYEVSRGSTQRPSQEEIDASVAKFEEERRATKVMLWNQIKDKSLSRLITSLYTLALLALQTHIQLNLIGRRTYISSLEANVRDDSDGHRVELQGPGVDGNEDEEQARTTDRQYLTCSWWFLHNGWKVVAERVEAAVAAEVAEMPLRTLLSATHFRELVQSIRSRVEENRGGPAHGYADVLLPSKAYAEVEMLRQSGAVDSAEGVTPQLRQLLDETNDYIDSPDFARVIDSSLNRVFEHFYEALAPSFSNGAVETLLLFAKVLPLVAQQAQVVCHSSPNEYVDVRTC